MKHHIPYLAAALLITTVLNQSCNKLIDIPAAKDQIETTTVFADSTIATTALLGAYYTMGTVHTAMKFVSLYADEYTSTSATTLNTNYANSLLLSNNTNNTSLWGNLYSVIYQCNAVLEGCENSLNLSPGAKKQLSGEASFLRAFAYFYLVNLYDNIPLLLSTDVDLNRSAVQVSPQAVYTQLLEDLIRAQQNLGTSYLGTGRVRATSFCADALLARVYLYLGNWQAAADASSKVISSNQFNIKDVKAEDAFLSSSPEAILQLWMVNGFLTDVAQLIPASATVVPAYPLRDNLYTFFENGDLRKSKWTGTNTVTTAGKTTVYPYPAKYKARTANPVKPEFVMALRLGEQYLIHAEATAQLNQTTATISDLNVIRTRAGLTPLDEHLNQIECLQAVNRERRIELFGEWGNRFLDLKRSGQLTPVLSPVKPYWKESAGAFPIPGNELIYNPKLKQNNGYAN